MRTKSLRTVAAVTLFLLPIQGCSLNFDAATLGVPASVSGPPGSADDGTEFVVSGKAVFLLFGILRASQPSLENTLAGQLVDGSEVTNLEIKVRSRFADLLITVLTGGLVVPRSVTFRGRILGGTP